VVKAAFLSRELRLELAECGCFAHADFLAYRLT